MKKMILLVVMLTLVAFVSGVMAQQKPAPEKTAAAPAKLEKFSGAIEKVDEMAKAIDVKGRRRKP
jgi:outer membrane lipoprotein-sorting protein